MGARRGKERGRRRAPIGGLGLGRDGLWRRLAGGAGTGCPGLGASVGGEEGVCGLDLG